MKTLCSEALCSEEEAARWWIRAASATKDVEMRDLALEMAADAKGGCLRPVHNGAPVVDVLLCHLTVTYMQCGSRRGRPPGWKVPA
jgi:hypothetical protein